ncbi:MAG TPA: hypothetical protein DCX89_08310 [Saprospirales bacterium]|nr:hypothetical protein [Saprospirales bacterium]HAY71879.1 hypothetical protein [Saprospirales bacterium]HRQ28591.1 hypothetical protein [Saprospiraceae bacterium]
MEKGDYTGRLKILVDKARNGSIVDVDFILDHLSSESILVMTRFINFALSNVETKEGMERIKYYLFNGSQIQRNYASLFFNRRGDWEIVLEAFRQGKIDEIQAFAR